MGLDFLWCLADKLFALNYEDTIQGGNVAIVDANVSIGFKIAHSRHKFHDGSGVLL